MYSTLHWCTALVHCNGAQLWCSVEDNCTLLLTVHLTGVVDRPTAQWQETTGAARISDHYWLLDSSPSPGMALHCTALKHTALHSTERRCTELHCTSLHFTSLPCTAQYITELHCTALHCTSLNWTGLDYIKNSALHNRLYSGLCPKMHSPA